MLLFRPDWGYFCSSDLSTSVRRISLVRAHVNLLCWLNLRRRFDGTSGAHFDWSWSKFLPNLNSCSKIRMHYSASFATQSQTSWWKWHSRNSIHVKCTNRLSLINTMFACSSYPTCSVKLHAEVNGGRHYAHTQHWNTTCVGGSYHSPASHLPMTYLPAEVTSIMWLFGVAFLKMDIDGTTRYPYIVGTVQCSLPETNMRTWRVVHEIKVGESLKFGRIDWMQENYAMNKASVNVYSTCTALGIISQFGSKQYNPRDFCPGAHWID